MLRRRFLIALADARHSIRAILGTTLELLGNVAALFAAPVSAEAELSLGMEAEVTIRPVAPAESEEGLSLTVEPEEVHALDSIPLSCTDGISLGIEAVVYVYNKAEAVLDEGFTILLESQPTAGMRAAAELDEALSIDLEAKAYAPDSVSLSFEDTVSMGVEGAVSNPESCPITAEAEPVELGMGAAPQTRDPCPIPALTEIELSIEAVVTVLPVAAISAELGIGLDSEAELFTEETDWIYPEVTADYLYIRQVCNIVKEE